jgi:hypothetical protein
MSCVESNLGSIIPPTFYFGGTGVWTQGLVLTRQVLYCLRHFLLIFPIGSCIYAQASLDLHPLFILPT